MNDDDTPHWGNDRSTRIHCKQGAQFRQFYDECLGVPTRCECCRGACHVTESSAREVSCTLLQLLTAIVEVEIDHNLPKTAMQKILQVVRMGRPAEDLKIIPSSVHLLRRALGVKDLVSIEHHLCPCGAVYEDQVGLSARQARSEETCNRCTRKRFVRCGNTVRPARHFYYFGVDRQIQSLFRSKSFRTSRLKSVSEDRVGNDLYQSELFKHILQVEETAGDQNTSIWSIGVDGAQPFNKKVHSCVQIVMRC